MNVSNKPQEYVVVVQLLSHVQLFVTPWTAARQAFLSFTISQSLLQLMSIESVMPSNQLILCHPFLLLPSLFPSIRVFSNGEVFISGGQSVGASASASVLPMNSQDWFPLGLTGLISLQCKGLSGVFSNTTIQKHQFFGAQPSLRSNFHIHTWQLEKPQLWTYEPLLVNLAFCSIMNTGNKPQEYEQCLSMTWLPVNTKHIFLSYYSYFSHYFKIAMVIESSNR